MQNKNKSYYTKDKSKVIRIRVSEADYNDWKETAETIGTTLSEYLRTMIRKGKHEIVIRPTVPIPEISRTLSELGRIGNNLNQIAHWLNSGSNLSSPTRHLLEENLMKLNETSTELRKVVRDLNGNIKAHGKSKLTL